MRREYESDWSPSPDSRWMIAKADEIARQYAASGYGLTLRQMYYQFVAQDLLPNSDRSYKRLGTAVAKGRMAGMIDWSHLTDRTRNPNLALTGGAESSVRSILSRLGDRYYADHWQDQKIRVEVWVEKEALGEVVQRAASRLGVSSLACRGYMSASEMWEAGQRFSEYIEEGQRVVVLHLGDHDPSGLDMTRDIRERLETFVAGNWAHDMRMETPQDFAEWVTGEVQHGTTWDRDAIMNDIREVKAWWDDPITVDRIALNWDQIQAYGPPPNPAKFTDARAQKYVEEYGPESWELDALPPDVLDRLITDKITELLDVDAFNLVVDRVRMMRRKINEATADLADRLEGEI